MTKDKENLVRFGEGWLKKSEYENWEKELVARLKKEKRSPTEDEFNLMGEKLKKKFVRKVIKKIEKVKELVKDVELHTKEIYVKQTEELIEQTRKNFNEISKKKIKKRKTEPSTADIAKDFDTICLNTRKGKSLTATAHTVNLSREGLSLFLLRYYHEKSFSSFKRKLVARHKKIATPSGEKKQRLIKDWVKCPRPGFKDREEAGLDPVVSTENKNWTARYYPKVKPGTRWSGDIEIISDRIIQPVKRTRIAAHSFLGAEAWSSGNLIRNVLCELAKTPEDKYLTVEGGIIINRSFALRDGLKVGDKILGLNGLKGIVAEVRRKQRTELLINKNQIWDDRVPGKDKVKSSRLCGGAVLELESNKLKVFYQPEHKVRENFISDWKSENFYNIATAYKEPRTARFSPDLVPFLAYYLSQKELIALQGDNGSKMQDILYMLNIKIIVENKFLKIVPKYTQPEERKGGNLYDFNDDFWGKAKWEKGLSKEAIVVKGEEEYSFYPFIIKKLWVPDWFIAEHTYEKGKQDRILKSLLYPEEHNRLRQDSIFLIYKHVFREIQSSIGYLIATPKNTSPDEVWLNQLDAENVGIKEGDYVLVYRYPVVSKLNIQKMKVVFKDITPTTIGINVESIRLMYGDFDGDALFLIKIPQTKNFASKFKVSSTVYKKERDAIEKEIKLTDLVEIPSGRDAKRKIRIALREAFISDKISTGLQEKKLSIFRKNVAKMSDTEIRSEESLIEEGKFVHNNLNKTNYKVQTVGGLTKWMWVTTTNTKKDEAAILAVSSLEVMKDRADIASQKEYEEKVELLESLKDALKRDFVDKETGEVKSKIPSGFRQFHKMVMSKTYEGGGRKIIDFGKIRDKELCDATTPYAKFILALLQP